VKLTELNPRWFAEEGRRGQGVIFDCPGCRAGVCADAKDRGRPFRLAVACTPLDGGSPFPIGKPGLLFDAIEAAEGEEWNARIVPPGVVWGRTGDTFDTLTLSPSVDASAAGHWHGWVSNGECR
jgi:hypothetical protein